jgi:hypothetical protein
MRENSSGASSPPICRALVVHRAWMTKPCKPRASERLALHRARWRTPLERNPSMGRPVAIHTGNL